MRTFSAKEEEVKKDWYLFDLKGEVLGRAASEIANLLRGKHKPIFTPHADTGDFVVAINAKQVRLTGKKWKEKVYYHHTGYMGGIKSITAEKLREKKPEELIKRAVKGMLPKNSLGRRLLKKLKVYAGNEHIHQAQTPKPYKLQ